MDFLQTNFAGSDYDPERDQVRMSDAMGSVFEVMSHDPDKWFSLEVLSELAGVPQSSVGSYLSYLRRDYNYTVPKKHVENGFYLYKLGRKLTPEQIIKRKAKRLKPIGDRKLFGEMMRTIYAYAHQPDIEAFAEMDKAGKIWRASFIEEISKNG